MGRLRKYFVQVEMQVFETPDTPVSAELVRTIQRRASRVLQAWREYRVKPYPGRLTLIRAEVGRHQPGVIDDAPQMGWGTWAGGGVDIAHLQARAHPDARCRALGRTGRCPRGTAGACAGSGDGRGQARITGVDAVTE